MYKLHIGNKNYSSWSLRPWLLMKMLDIPFEEVIHPFHDASDWDEFRKLSPNGMVPCLEAEGKIIWDSLGITDFLGERYDRVWREDQNARTWARCAASEMHSGFSGLRNHCSMNCGVRIKLHNTPDKLLKDLARIDTLWCQGLETFDGDFLVGSRFSAVDAFYAPIAFRLQTYGLKLSDTAMQYAERLLALEPMQQWYEAAINETWRDIPHDEECLAAGEILHDFRR